jgi:hypothetical protein
MGSQVTRTRRMGMNPVHERVEASPTIEELRLQHQDHERRLEELLRRPHLTPDEEIEAKRLKKLKLRLKDQIEHLRRGSC